MTAGPSSPAKPPIDVAFVFNSQTPYRLAFHLRVAREMPEIRIHSIFTHDLSNAGWRITNPPEIRATLFGPGESAKGQSDPRNAIREFKKAGRILRYFREHNIKAAVFGGYNDPGLLRMFAWCRGRAIPVMMFADSNIRDDHPAGLKAAAKRTVLRQIFRLVDVFLPCGTLGSAYFRRYGAAESKIRFMPYEPDYGLLQSITPPQVNAAAARFGLDRGRRRIVFSGRLIALKRPALLFGAFAAIAAERPEWDLLIVGDGPLRAELQASLPPQLHSRVTWTGFLDDQSAISALYRASDVLVLPSIREPWALVINEAAAAGLAIVCSDVVGAAAELVRDDVNGYTFATSPDAKAAAELTAALRKATDPARIDALKAASATVLADWRRRGDPIAGLRSALRLTRAID